MPRIAHARFRDDRGVACERAKLARNDGGDVTRADDLGQQGCHDLRQFGPGPRQIMNHLEPPRSHRRAQRLTRSQPQQIARRQRPDHAARLVDHSEVAHLAFGRSPDRRTRPQGPPPTACSSGARPACAASRLHSGRPPQDVTLGGDSRSRSAVLSAQQPGQRRCIHALGEFVMDVAQRHPQVIAHSREIAPAQLLVERRSAPGGASAPSTNSPTSASPSGKTRQRDCC